MYKGEYPHVVQAWFDAGAWLGQCSNYKGTPPLSLSLAQTHKNRSVPVWKEFSKKGFHRIRLIPGAKLSKFMLRQGTLDLGKCSKNKLEQLFFSFKLQLQKCCCKHQMSASFVNYFSREHLYTILRLELKSFVQREINNLKKRKCFF